MRKRTENFREDLYFSGPPISRPYVFFVSKSSPKMFSVLETQTQKKHFVRSEIPDNRKMDTEKRLRKVSLQMVSIIA